MRAVLSFSIRSRFSAVSLDSKSSEVSTSLKASSASSNLPNLERHCAFLCSSLYSKFLGYRKRKARAISCKHCSY